ncbi:MAG TPA: hypothetical protein DE042_01815 [Colwellia sp.]|nr:hypothetical protein [Colwellia sp.]
MGFKLIKSLRVKTLNEITLISKILESLVEVAPEILPDEINPSVNFRDQFEIDSIDYLNFILTLEKKLNIKIPDFDYPKLSSQAGCLSYLSSHTIIQNKFEKALATGDH